MKLISYTTLITLVLLAPRLAQAANLRARVAFSDEVLKFAVKSWLNNPVAAEEKYGHISQWDVSRVKDISSLFENAVDFDEDLSAWDVSNVRDMKYAFANASSFSGDLAKWDISKVKHTRHMFHGASSFDCDLSKWNTTNVLNFSYMFAGASSFNGNVSTWDITNAYDLSYMFLNATSFNGDISRWTIETNVEGGFRIKWVQNMKSMFQGASSFNGDLSRWETYAAYDMNSMFKNASSFSGNLSSWEVRNVKDFSEMFVGSAFNQSLCWDRKDDSNTSNMFEGTSASFSTDCDSQIIVQPEHDEPVVFHEAPSASGASSILRGGGPIVVSVAIALCMFFASFSVL